MKRTLALILLFFVFFGTVAYAEDLCFTSARTIGETVERAIPTEFGYVDNTKYYLNKYFTELHDVDDCYIVTSADSTNFNEFGIFHLKSKAELRSAKKILRDYLDKRKAEFEGGVVYNVQEYPKFENATVITFGNYICYTILSPSDVKKATSAVKSLLTE